MKQAGYKFLKNVLKSAKNTKLPCTFLQQLSRQTPFQYMSSGRNDLAPKELIKEDFLVIYCYITKKQSQIWWLKLTLFRDSALTVYICAVLAQAFVWL